MFVFVRTQAPYIIVFPEFICFLSPAVVPHMLLVLQEESSEACHCAQALRDSSAPTTLLMKHQMVLSATNLAVCALLFMLLHQQRS